GRTGWQGRCSTLASCRPFLRGRLGMMFTLADRRVEMTKRFPAVFLLIVGALMISAAPARKSQPKHLSEGINILWRDPGRVEALDFVNGVGGSAKAPLGPFQFVEEDMSGSNPKIKVRDAHGEEWSVKWSEEAKPEAFASRL